MKKIKAFLKMKRYQFKMAKRIFKDDTFYGTYYLSKQELAKDISRTQIINFLVELVQGENYLEIGVRNPEDNFNRIRCRNKYSIDPGLEYKENLADFKMTSSQFFESLKNNKLSLNSSTKFDVIFIDGLHLADQTYKDIENSLSILSQKGVIILHDCNPPTEYHAREDYNFRNSPARGFWNGTTWKAFYKYRYKPNIYSITFDTDWGVSVISKVKYPKFNRLEGELENIYFEYSLLDKKRDYYLNIQDFKVWSKQLK